MFHLKILTPEEIYFEGQVQALIAPGSVGYFEILTDHAPFISSLKKGDVIIRGPNKSEKYFIVTGGVFEVHNNNASLLADTIEPVLKTHISLTGIT